MSAFMFSENKEQNVKAIKEALKYLELTFQVYPIGEGIVSVGSIKRLVADIESGKVR